MSRTHPVEGPRCGPSKLRVFLFIIHITSCFSTSCFSTSRILLSLLSLHFGNLLASLTVLSSVLSDVLPNVLVNVLPKHHYCGWWAAREPSMPPGNRRKVIGTTRNGYQGGQVTVTYYKLLRYGAAVRFTIRISFFMGLIRSAVTDPVVADCLPKMPHLPR